MDFTPLSDCLRPGDRVLVGQALGEPVGLVADLFALAPRLEPLQVFCGFSLNPAWQGEVPAGLSLSTYCGMGTVRQLVAKGRARVLPSSHSQLSALIASRLLPVDVVLLQVSPADAQGYHSVGPAMDYAWEAAQQARVVVVEVNHRLPATRGSGRLHGHRVVVARETDAPLLELPSEPLSEVQQQVARQVAQRVPDGATVQLGIGGLAAAVAGALGQRRGLKIRSGMVGDWMLDLQAQGALDTATPDACLASLAVGSQALYDSLSLDGQLGFALPAQLTVVVAGSPLMAINSGIEVDLRGQVNAEYLGERYVGAVGGQTDYFRAARRSHGGLAIVALPASSGREALSRIVARCGHVTSAQSDVDLVVTEHGVADLRATTLPERRERIASVADPRVRQALLASLLS